MYAKTSINIPSWFPYQSATIFHATFTLKWKDEEQKNFKEKKIKENFLSLLFIFLIKGRRKMCFKSLKYIFAFLFSCDSTRLIPHSICSHFEKIFKGIHYLMEILLLSLWKWKKKIFNSFFILFWKYVWYYLKFI